jgi:acyl-CoA ligase (AMP-forming) (exosortase A-associated)
VTEPYLLHHLLARAEAVDSGKEAVVDRERRFTFRDLGVAARAYAQALTARGVGRRDRVAIYLEKSFEEVVCIFGISMADAVFVPCNALLKAGQVRHILDDCQVKVIITNRARLEALREAEGSLPQVLLVEEVPAAAEGGFAPVEACIGEDLAAILYTSGSTGRPKGVMLSHRNLLAGSRIVSTYLELRGEDRILSILPFSFDYGLNQLITAVDRSATIVLLTFHFGDQIVRALAAERITGLAGVPTIWAVLTSAAPSLLRTPLPALRYLTNSGGAVPTETVRRIRQVLPHVQLFLMYGLTEAFRSTYLPPAEVDRRPTSIGRAIPETEVFLIDPATGRRCEPGEQGILIHRGPTVSLGYWNRPDATAEALRLNPLLGEHEGADTICYSGDLVRTDDEGFLYFVGRNDAMIKSAGFRISPSEVEEVLMASGHLAQAAVIGLFDAVMGERVHALVVPETGAEVDRDALLARCVRDLPAHMVPRAIEIVSELPRSPNGKVDYKRLKAERSGTTP